MDIRCVIGGLLWKNAYRKWFKEKDLQGESLEIFFDV